MSLFEWTESQSAYLFISSAFDSHSSLSSSIMVRRVVSHPEEYPAPPNSEDYLWVDAEVLGTRSSFVDVASLRPLVPMLLRGTRTEIENDYRLELAGVDDRVCLQVPEPQSWFYMYEEVVTVVGVKAPFTPFEIDLLRTLEVAPIQLHPNGWAHVRPFRSFVRRRN